MPEPVSFTLAGGCVALVISTVLLLSGGALLILGWPAGWLLLVLGTMFLAGFTFTTLRENSTG